LAAQDDGASVGACKGRTGTDAAPKVIGALGFDFIARL
jgi:hypothetical protein